MEHENRAEERTGTPPRFADVPLELIDDFPDHPFRVRMDEDMRQLVESVRERGLITPVLLREKKDGRYELVSGHRRKKACELAGMGEIRAEIREMTRDEAIVVMVESNLQRSEILPSEKAFAYKLRLEAMKRQAGRPPKENVVPVGQHFSREELSAQTGDSQTQIQRYIRLTELQPEILRLVDEGRIALRPAVELSYLTRREQDVLAEAMAYTDCTPSHAQAIRLRTLSREGALSPRTAEDVMREEKPNQRETISVRYDEARKYIPAGLPGSRAREYILKALEFYHRHLERQRAGRAER
jgi:ParB family chromosome partitioning protein